MALPVPAPSPTAPLRAWRVDLDPAHTWWSCTAPRCTGAERARGRRATVVALGHLAAHAAAEPLPAHLRTCRCHAHGCRWHPRHRGCQGPVTLTVFRSRGGVTWQLADTCSACAMAIPHAAQLPQHPPTLPTHHRPGPARQTPTTPSGTGGLRPLLTYLDAALLPRTTARTRLVALLCLLRADRDGTVRLPHGLLRGWRLADSIGDHLAELTEQRWLRQADPGASSTGPHGLAVADGTGIAVLRTTSRRMRRHLLDQAGRLQCLPPEERLAALRRTPSPVAARTGPTPNKTP